MYSVVLLMAMTGTPDAAAFGHRHSCDGGCYGCTGCTGCYGCSGCSGCHGGHAKKSHGCCGCTGYTSCCGCCGVQVACGCCGVPVYTGCCGCYGGMMVAPVAPPPVMKGAMTAAPATIVVSLPADAALKVDGMKTKATSQLRTFATPELPYGESFHYTLTAEIVRDGQTLTTTQQVTVRGGLTSQVEIPTTAFGQVVAMK